MNRLVPNVACVLFIMSIGCTFDLTEVRPDPRDAGVVVLIETTRGSATRGSIHVDPGITEAGVARTLLHEAVLLDGVAHHPTEQLADGRLYEIQVAESTPSLGIVLPSIRGMADVPAFVAVPLRVLVPDTVSDNGAGFLEIPVLGGDDGDASSQSSWNAFLYAAGATARRLTVAGTHPIPSVLRVPTIHLSPDVQGGHVTVLGTSVRTVSPDPALEIVLQRTMYADVPFRLIH